MITKVWKSGNSFVVTLPRAEMKRAALADGTKVKVVSSAPGMIEVRRVEWDMIELAKSKGAENESE